MEPIPKIVQQHLAGPPPGSHPDPDLLSAFSENSLNQRERAEVLQHLAQCAHCREVTALSAPQPEVELMAAATVDLSASAENYVAPRKSSLRWGTLAACAVILVAAVLFSFRPQHKIVAHQPAPLPLEAKKETLPMGEMRAAPESSRVQSDSTVSSQQPKSEPADKDRLSPHRKAATGGSTTTAKNGSLAGAATAQGDTATQAAVQTPQSQINVPAAAEQVTVAEPRPAVTSESVEVTSSAPELGDAKATGRKMVNSAQLRPGVARLNASRGSSLGLLRWTLANGQLQRSLDAGKTWQPVVIESNPNFRVISVMGKEIWAGGDKGVLYHSPDEGAHWVHVVPSTEDQSLKDDIVRLDFIDADHGKLITSGNDVWQTNNCGASWQKQ